MHALAKDHHLLQRKGRWYYQRRVPTRFWDKHGLIVKQALGTGDRREAQRLRDQLDADWNIRFEPPSPVVRLKVASHSEPAGDRPELSKTAVIRLVRTYVSETDRTRYSASLSEAELTSETRAEAAQNAQLELAIASGRARQYDHVGYVSETMDQLLSGANAVVRSADRDEVYALVKRALIELARREVARTEDNHSSSFFDRLFDPAEQDRVTVEQLIAQYVAYETEEAVAHGRSLRHIEKVQAQARIVAELLGPSKVVADISYDDCRSACSTLAKMRPRRPGYSKLSIAQAIDRGEADGVAPLSKITQQQYLAVLKKVLQLGVSKGLLRTNPASDLQPLAVDRTSADRKRTPFDAQQLKALFRSEFYRDCAKAKVPFLQAEHDWRFWLPLICLFTGMRPREVCQLHVDDVRQTEKGTWFIQIEPTSERTGPFAKTIKTQASRRSIPISMELQRIGFLQFVATKRGKGSDDPRLFPSLKRTRHGDPARYPMKRFNEVYLPAAIDMRPDQVFYSFRHTWRDATRALEATDDFLKHIGAWSEGRVTSDIYGSSSHPDRYAPMMDRISFEKLDLSHLHVRG